MTSSIIANASSARCSQVDSSFDMQMQVLILPQGPGRAC